ncbi:hypothetical protein LCM20_17620 [Halobacillus litoralis]|uniref:hypothetical protein n=1 Tax=Halobacillus litoralis TaxID=45668 RepID=UPI001CD1E115|nr:hypothetical protein [Halobacillus litoralis]MCA0972417.1 hypothetical protein [Halobacillus litoralis]
MKKHEKSLYRWKKMREKGKWRYIAINGLLLAGSFFFFFTILLNQLFSNPEPISTILIRAITFGTAYGIVTWVIWENRYKKSGMEQESS